MLLTATVAAEPNVKLERSLAGWWPLRGDCRDYSGNGNHGENHNVDLATGSFNGQNAYISVPHSRSLELGTSDFSFSVRVHTHTTVNDVLGDILSKFDGRRRAGFNLALKSSSGGYQSSGDDRQVHFGIDNARLSEWQDCGRPSETSNYVSNSLTVFDGHLYAAITDARDQQDWCHVFRYSGGSKWTDCGRVGAGKTTGVMSLIVHQGSLYAATTTYDWTRVFSGKYDPVRVYRYAGGTKWIDCGQPGECLRINCMATFQGKLFAGGDRGMLRPGERQWKGRPYKVYEYAGGTTWNVAAEFPAEEPKNCYPHAMAVHDGRLYVGYPNVYSYDGKKWRFEGTPLGKTPPELRPMLQVHSLDVHRGRLLAGMWPEARAVAKVDGAGQSQSKTSQAGSVRHTWKDMGRLGDGTEINALTVYNGKLYGGAIPRAEVSRYDDERDWSSLRRFFSPPKWDPGTPQSATREQVNDWSRATSLTVFQGRMFASIGSCTASVKDAPADVRGKVFSIEAGKCVSYDKDIGAGWKHLVVVRASDRLTVYVDGKRVAESSKFKAADYDIKNDRPLQIGFGEMDYFSGRIQDVRIYTRALSVGDIEALSKER